MNYVFGNYHFIESRCQALSLCFTFRVGALSIMTLDAYCRFFIVMLRVIVSFLDTSECLKCQQSSFRF
jgi:hypothetical protein